MKVKFKKKYIEEARQPFTYKADTEMLKQGTKWLETTELKWKSWVFPVEMFEFKQDSLWDRFKNFCKTK
jgi:hypothetical protein